MKKFIITEDDLKGLLCYLETRPYKEVAQGISNLIQLKELKEEDVKHNND